MKKLISLISTLCVLNALMLAGLLGFLAVTGRLDKSKAQTIADMLKQPGTPDKFREQVYDILQPPPPQTPPATATSPATSPAVLADGAPATAEERIDYVNKMLEQERLKLERDRQALRSEQKSLADMQAEVETKMKQIADREKGIGQQLTKVVTQSEKDNFNKTLALYDEMKTKQIKDILVLMPVEQAAKYVGAMEPDRAAKILDEFKTPEEKLYMNGLLDQLRGAGTSSASGKAASGSNAAAGTGSLTPKGAAAPAATPGAVPMASNSPAVP